LICHERCQEEKKKPKEFFEFFEKENPVLSIFFSIGGDWLGDAIPVERQRQRHKREKQKKS
jgi:hypothetical protein